MYRYMILSPYQAFGKGSTFKEEQGEGVKSKSESYVHKSNI